MVMYIKICLVLGHWIVNGRFFSNNLQNKADEVHWLSTVGVL